MKKFIHLSIFVFIVYSCTFPSDDFEIDSNLKETITIDDYMYQVEGEFLTTFDISNPNDITKIDEHYFISRPISFTTFGGLLFVNFQTSMEFFSIGEDGIPIEDDVLSIRQFSDEQTPCDPSIIVEDVAYVSLPKSPIQSYPCFRPEDINEVRVYDLTNINSPKFVDTLQLTNPVRLTYDKNLLFVADDNDGLKIYDTTTPSNLILLNHFDETNVSNVVISSGQLVAIGDDELSIYEYNNPNDIHQKSRIEL